MLKPLGENVVIVMEKVEEVTKSGIVLPSQTKEKSQIGEIVAIGPGEKNDKGEYSQMNVKVGDKVLVAKYAGTEFEYMDEKYYIVNQKEILAVVE